MDGAFTKLRKNVSGARKPVLDGTLGTVMGGGGGGGGQWLETVKAPGVVDLEASVKPEQFKKQAVGEEVKSC